MDQQETEELLDLLVVWAPLGLLGQLDCQVTQVHKVQLDHLGPQVSKVHLDQVALLVI